MQSIAELKVIGKEYEASKTKLLRLTTSANLKEQDYERMCEVAREMGIAINKVKIQVLNKLGLSAEVKAKLLSELKNLQIVS
jgi:DNA-binding SARP family transcriptional activator